MDILPQYGLLFYTIFARLSMLIFHFLRNIAELYLK